MFKNQITKGIFADRLLKVSMVDTPIYFCVFPAQSLADISWLLSLLWHHSRQNVQGLDHFQQAYRIKGCKCSYHQSVGRHSKRDGANMLFKKWLEHCSYNPF